MHVIFSYLDLDFLMLLDLVSFMSLSSFYTLLYSEWLSHVYQGTFGFLDGTNIFHDEILAGYMNFNDYMMWVCWRLSYEKMILGFPLGIKKPLFWPSLPFSLGSHFT